MNIETLNTGVGMVGLLLVWGAYALGIVALSIPMACVAVLFVGIMIV
jgi:hypothetical protein